MYIWKHHPLAKEKSISFEQLDGYPCLSFEQEITVRFYLAEEILSTNEYSQVIQANDRATMLNLMIGLNGYTCVSVLSARLNGNEYVAVSFQADRQNPNSVMEIGYIGEKKYAPQQNGVPYVEALKKYLNIE